MTGILQDILCVLSGAAAGVLWALVSAVNVVIAGLAVAAQGLLLLLPNLPDPPELPGGEGTARVLSYVGYFYPVGPVMGVFALIVTVWLLMLAVTVGLRWVKVF